MYGCGLFPMHVQHTALNSYCNYMLEMKLSVEINVFKLTVRKQIISYCSKSQHVMLASVYIICCREPGLNFWQQKL